MPFSSIEARLRAPHPARVVESPAWLWEARTRPLQRILEGGGWTVHDLINRAEIRAAVETLWLLAARMEEDRAIAAYLSYLEALAALTPDPR